jgi:hypothetical protein
MSDRDALAHQSYLDDEPAIERAAIQMWVDEMAHFRDNARSRASARRRWDTTTEGVRESWRAAARRVLAAAEGDHA